jgi:hypothetical protein
MPNNKPAATKQAAPSWRDILKIHPAAEVDPMMSDDELRVLGEDIKKNGLQHPITTYDGMLLDGRQRLDGMEKADVKLVQVGRRRRQGRGVDL